MEDSEETRKVEQQEEDKFFGEIIVDRTSEVTQKSSRLDSSSNLKTEAEAAEKNPDQVQDSGLLEEVEKPVVNSIVQSTECVVYMEEKFSESIESSEEEKFENSDVVEVEVKEAEEKVSVLSLNETNAIPPVPKDGGVAEAVFHAAEGLPHPITNAASKGVEEAEVLESLDENDSAPPATSTEGIEEAKVVVLEENTGESSGDVGMEADESTSAVRSSDAFPESTGNPRPSWRSCCDIFEALRRSNR